MQSSRLLISAVTLTLTTLATTAMADSGYWYAGAGIGATRYGVPTGSRVIDKPGTINPSAFTATEDIKDSATGFRLDVGYRLNTYFGLEGTYADFGSANSTFTTTSPSNSYSGSTKVRGEGLDAVGFWPLGDRFDLFAKAGLFHYKSDSNVAQIDVTGPFTSPTLLGTSYPVNSSTGTTQQFGAGVDYRFGGSFSLRLAQSYFRGKQSLYNGGLPLQALPCVHLTSLELLYTFN